MEKNLHNKLRAFAEVVSLDAWHSSDPNSPSRLTVHADVVFSEGRLGGEDESLVRFRVKMLRAQLVVIAPPTEPLLIEKSSVSRDTPRLVGEKTTTKILNFDAEISSTAKLDLELTGASANSKNEASATAKSHSEKELKFTEELKLISTKQTRTPDGHYRWDLTPAIGDSLDGRPWDANSEPRLVVTDTRPNISKGIPPVTRVEVRCLREDISITNIELKEGSLWTALKSRKGFTNKKAAAEAYIRHILIREGLPCGDISDPYCAIVLATTSTDSI